jgi:hypothetical protein
VFDIGGVRQYLEESKLPSLLSLLSQVIITLKSKYVSHNKFMNVLTRMK